jgi:hypothetical protein
MTSQDPITYLRKMKMNEKDFVYAWLLATRTTIDSLREVKTSFYIGQAQEVYRRIEQEYSDEVISRTED